MAAPGSLEQNRNKRADCRAMPRLQAACTPFTTQPFAKRPLLASSVRNLQLSVSEPCCEVRHLKRTANLGAFGNAICQQELNLYEPFAGGDRDF